jgi:hypothetical protein
MAVPASNSAAVEKPQDVCTGGEQLEAADGSCSVPYGAEADQQRRHLLHQQQVLTEGGVPQRVNPTVSHGSSPAGKALQSSSSKLTHQACMAMISTYTFQLYRECWQYCLV